MNLPAITSLLSQAEPVVESAISGGDKSLISLAAESGTVIQLTLIILVIFSVITWAIIGSKHRQLSKAKKGSNRFYQLFWQAQSIDAMVSKAKFRKCPALNVFKVAVDTLREDQSQRAAIRVEKEIKKATEDEIEQMEYGVPFLATTATVCPFIGLFGTVWGVLFAFWKIGRTGSSSLAVIGPHVAEALTTTALGLIAAIPAVFFYNYYVTKIRTLSRDLSDFADDLNNRIVKEYFGST